MYGNLLYIEKMNNAHSQQWAKAIVLQLKNSKMGTWINCTSQLKGITDETRINVHEN